MHTNTKAKRDLTTTCPRVTPTEAKVLALMADGFSAQETADELIVSRRTVEWHIANLLFKFGCSKSLRLVAEARRFGII